MKANGKSVQNTRHVDLIIKNALTQPKKRDAKRNSKGHYGKGNTASAGNKRKAYTSILSEMLLGNRIEVSWTINGEKKSLEVTSDKNLYYGVAAVQVMEALKGNTNATKEIIDRTEGRSLQSIAAISEVTFKGTDFSELLKKSKERIAG